ncbi:MAG: hypothetical protein FJ293_01830 [Planctomycetes bacterium]|nr:hypothetical protein [Planctomycetota bacterium]
MLRPRMTLLASTLLASGCAWLTPGPGAHTELPEPDVFDVIRASNSKAAVEQLRIRHARELEHARLLESRIGELMAAEEGLALEHRERMAALREVEDRLRKLTEEQADTTRALDAANQVQVDLAAQLEAARQQNAALEAALAAEQAKRAELDGKTGGG